MHTKYSSGDIFDHKKRSFFAQLPQQNLFAQIRNAEETLVLSDALLLAARVSGSSKQVVYDNDNDFDTHEMIKSLGWQAVPSG